MPREKRKIGDMFNELQSLSVNVRLLAGIVQNEGAEIPDDILMEWLDSVNDQINKLSSLKEDVVRYYQD